ncbi:MAG: bile acid:sodium symporter family protein [Burkholderiaceae bacterium]
MSTVVMMQLLLVALALVMTGLGMSLQRADFVRLLTLKRAVALALCVQMLVLPAVALALAYGFDLPPPFAIGLLLLAATPGSISANLFSHLFGGAVALNISLSGINTLLAAVTLPLVCGWSMQHFSEVGQTVPPLFGKVAEIIAIIVGPVTVGMLVRGFAPRFTQRAERPMRLVSASVLAFFVVAAIAKEWQALVSGFGQVGGAVVAFNVLSLAAGYGTSRVLAFDRPTSISITFQVSIHNAVLAIYVAMTVLEQPLMALPAAVYSVTMNLLAFGFGLWVAPRRIARAAAPAVQPARRPA